MPPSSHRFPLAALIIGDIIVFQLFAVLGRSAHGMVLTPAGIAGTSLPFLAAWLVVAALLGGFRPDALRSPGRAALRAAGLWTVAAPVALVARAIALSRGIPLSFALISYTTVLILLPAWRALFAWRLGRN